MSFKLTESSIHFRTIGTQLIAFRFMLLHFAKNKKLFSTPGPWAVNRLISHFMYQSYMPLEISTIPIEKKCIKNAAIE